MAGKLYLIPTPLGEEVTNVLPQYALDIIHTLDEFIAERAKTARRFLKAYKTPVPFQDMTFYELNKRTDKAELPSFLKNAKAGKSIGLLSEAGCPGVADPGAEIVALAHQMGIEVIPMIGPSSILLALMASGMNGQSFTFNGYLGVKTPERLRDLKNLEQLAKRNNQTQIFIETPYRNMSLIQDMIKALTPRTLLCIAVDITLPTQYIKTQSIAAWRKTELPDFHKRPAIFLIG